MTSILTHRKSLQSRAEHFNGGDDCGAKCACERSGNERSRREGCGRRVGEQWRDFRQEILVPEHVDCRRRNGHCPKNVSG
jgi:hypothetical protein